MRNRAVDGDMGNIRTDKRYGANLANWARLLTASGRCAPPDQIRGGRSANLVQLVSAANMQGSGRSGCKPNLSPTRMTPVMPESRGFFAQLTRRRTGYRRDGIGISFFFLPSWVASWLAWPPRPTNKAPDCQVAARRRITTSWVQRFQRLVFCLPGVLDSPRTAKVILGRCERSEPFRALGC